MNLYLFESPLSVILAISLLLLSALIGISQSPKKVISGKKGKGIASTALSISAILVAIEGTFNFSSEIHRSVPFIIIVAALLLFLGSSIFENITSRKFSLKLFTHIGLFLMIAGGFFGAPDHSDSQIAVTREVAENTSYTTKGEIIELPKGATPIDFAYKIHTDIGNTMVGAFVNDAYVPIDYILQNKDRVRIVTDELSYGPREDWIEKVKTSHAKRKIKEFNKK